MATAFDIIKQIGGQTERDRVRTFLTAYIAFCDQVCSEEPDLTKAFNIIQQTEIELTQIEDEVIGKLDISRWEEELSELIGGEEYPISDRAY
jgi:hypothetical protein